MVDEVEFEAVVRAPIVRDDDRLRVNPLDHLLLELRAVPGRQHGRLDPSTSLDGSEDGRSTTFAEFRGLRAPCGCDGDRRVPPLRLARLAVHGCLVYLHVA